MGGEEGRAEGLGAASSSPSLSHLERLLHIWSWGRWEGRTQQRGWGWRRRKRWARERSRRCDQGEAVKERLVGGREWPPALQSRAVSSGCPGRPGPGRGARVRILRHHELRLHVGVHFRLPHRVLKVEAQARGFAGAAASRTAAAVTAAGLSGRRPVIRAAGIPPGLSAQPLLLQQELQPLHLAARGPVLCLPEAVPRGLAHADLALALEQGGRRHRGQLLAGGSFGGEVRGWRGR